MQGRMAAGFVVLKKDYDTVPREMVRATVRWMGVPEAEARMVEEMYKSIREQQEELWLDLGYRKRFLLTSV